MTRRGRDKPSRGRTKADLPQMLCVACARPFAWRKKWALDWESVRYCSQRCRRHKSPTGDYAV